MKHLISMLIIAAVPVLSSSALAQPPSNPGEQGLPDQSNRPDLSSGSEEVRQSSEEILESARERSEELRRERDELPTGLENNPEAAERSQEARERAEENDILDDIDNQ